MHTFILLRRASPCEVVFWVGNKRFVGEKHRLGALASEDPPDLSFFLQARLGILGAGLRKRKMGVKHRET